MSLVIITDSCADLPEEIINAFNVHVMPMSVTIENKSYMIYPDERDLKLVDFYNMLRDKKVAKTSQINTNEFIEFVTPIIEAKHDVLIISFSSALSGTYNSIRLGVEELKEKHQDRKIEVIDSLSASLGQGLLVYKALQYKAQGHNLEETRDYVEKIKLSLVHLFTVDDLGTLKRGGRLSSTASFIGTLFQLKPVLHVSDEGKLVPVTKVRGRKASYAKLIEILSKKITDFDTLFISHGDCLDDALRVKDMILKEHPQIKEVIMNPIGPTIGAHSGPGTIAVFFLGNIR